jgi:hypothetical protein
MADPREEIIKKIRALRARAANEASSEAEVEAAASRAAKLIQQHEVSESELRERGISGVIEGEHNSGRRSRHPALETARGGIAIVTHCHLLVGSYYKGALTWVGQPEDVEFAIYLSELVQGASERAYREHRKSRTKTPTRHWRESFLGGFGLGVRNRLLAIERDRQAAKAAETTTGTDLTVIKDQIVASYLQEAYPAIPQEKRRKGKDADPFAAIMGMEAATHLNVSAPLTDRSDKNDALTTASTHSN